MNKPTQMSVLPAWMQNIPLQQQSVIILALRGPDGDPKYTVFKNLLRALRGTVLCAAKYGRHLQMGERADSFMSLDRFADWASWQQDVKGYCEDMADGAILHAYTHFMHAAQVLAYKHPDFQYRERWLYCYHMMVERLHLYPETEQQMDDRLSDWDQKYWGPYATPTEKDLPVNA